MSSAFALMIACAAASAGEKKILYTVQPNPPGPGGDYPGNTALDATWAAQICNNGEMPLAVETEWTPILDPTNQDAETHLVAVSGTVSYNPEPSESGYCQHTGCPGQPVPCLSDSDCSATACNGTAGTCDLAQGPSCTGGSCNSPWTKPQTGSPISCVSDAQCAASSACGAGTCSALGRSRGDLVSTHPFGFDYDVAIAPDPAYRSLLAPGNVASYHIDANGSARPGFEDVVYPFLHATTPVNQKTRGWCSPSFDDRCSVDADCPSGRRTDRNSIDCRWCRSTIAGPICASLRAAAPPLSMRRSMLTRRVSSLPRAARKPMKSSWSAIARPASPLAP
jgi:hypothetical protein